MSFVLKRRLGGLKQGSIYKIPLAWSTTKHVRLIDHLPDRTHHDLLMTLTAMLRGKPPYEQIVILRQ